MLQRLLFLCCFSLVSGRALCDTIDHWTVYLNNRVVGKFNPNDKPVLELPVDDDDTLSIVYRECSGNAKTVLVYYVAANDSVVGWNDGDYYTDNSTRFVLKCPNDSLFWDSAYYGDGRVEIPGKDLRAPLTRATGITFYYTNKSWSRRGFAGQPVFTLYLKPEELPK